MAVEQDFKRLKGVRTSPNEGVNLITQSLGIEFPVPPKCVILDRFNILRLLHSDPRLSLGLSPKSLLRPNDLAQGGGYMFKYNTVFLTKDDENYMQFAKLHEDMHAYAFQTNPDLQKPVRKLIDIVLDREEPSREAIELAEVRHVFSEGIANWGTIDVRARLPLSEPRTVTHLDDAHKKTLLLPSWRNAALEIPDEYALFISQLTVGNVDLLKITSDRGALEFMKMWEFCHSGINEMASYLLGNYFVYEAMSLLRNQGMFTKDALPLLIKNPPDTVDQLRNPRDFANRLIGSSS